MAIYAVVNGGVTVSTIVWDGITPYNPGTGNTLVPVGSAPAVTPNVVAPTPTFNQQVATAALAVGLINAAQNTAFQTTPTTPVITPASAVVL